MSDHFSTWIERTLVEFATFGDDPHLYKVEAIVRAGSCMEEGYKILFSGGVIANTVSDALRKDVESHLNGLRAWLKKFEDSSTSTSTSTTEITENSSATSSSSKKPISELTIEDLINSESSRLMSLHQQQQQQQRQQGSSSSSTSAHGGGGGGFWGGLLGGVSSSLSTSSTSTSFVPMTPQELIRADKSNPVWDLIWITRICLFVKVFGNHLVNTSQTKKEPCTSSAAKHAYTVVLEPYHSFLIASFAKLVLAATPNLHHFLGQLEMNLDEARGGMGKMSELLAAKIGKGKEEGDLLLVDKVNGGAKRGGSGGGGGVRGYLVERGVYFTDKATVLLGS